MALPHSIRPANPTRTYLACNPVSSHRFTLRGLISAAPSHRDMATYGRLLMLQQELRILQSTIRIQVTFSFPSPSVQDALLDFLTTTLGALPSCSAGARLLSSPGARHARDEPGRA
jgi:hypothetical protein